MWRFLHDRIIFVPEGTPGFEFVCLSLEEYRFDGTLVKIPISDSEYTGFDDWLQHFPKEEELSLVKKTLRMAEKDCTYRVHIQGISLAESIELLREYYKTQGYEDELAKNYTLPGNVQVTASISLRHALWCEKDKRFLSTKNKTRTPFGMVSPPIRGSHDLRALQQALRMNMLMGIEVFPGDEPFINILLEREILAPFSISQMIQFRWKKYGWSSIRGTETS